MLLEGSSDLTISFRYIHKLFFTGVLVVCSERNVKTVAEFNYS